MCSVRCDIRSWFNLLVKGDSGKDHHDHLIGPKERLSIALERE
jgi:hypothetical protein